MKSLTRLGQALRTIHFYKWAFGNLTEADSDLGMVAEYLVGERLSCLPPARKVNAPFDLVTKSGRMIEVKSTGHARKTPAGTPYHQWDISTQAAAIDGRRPLADVWIFLIADFADNAEADILDYRHWRAYVLSAEQIRTLTARKFVRESSIARLAGPSIPLADLTLRGV